MSTRPASDTSRDASRAVILYDEDVRDHLDPASALAWAEEALARHSDGDLSAPPRAHISLTGGRLVITAGLSGGDWYGYRSYDTLPTSSDEQVVVVHDATTGRTVALSIGTELGIRRTGALGGVAARALTGGAVNHLALIGTGQHAFAQLWAVNGFARPGLVTVFSRDPASRQRFRDRAAGELGVAAEARDTARDAVVGADVVILATNSSTPVIETSWLAEDVVVTTMGPKQVGRAEFPPDLVVEADFTVTDSVAQLRGYDPPALSAETSGMAELGDVVRGRVEAPTTGRRVYCSVGLAGSEVHVLGRLAQRMDERS